MSKGAEVQLQRPSAIAGKLQSLVISNLPRFKKFGIVPLDCQYTILEFHETSPCPLLCLLILLNISDSRSRAVMASGTPVLVPLQDKQDVILCMEDIQAAADANLPEIARGRSAHSLYFPGEFSPLLM